MKTFVAYVPVLHDGYRQFFQKHDGEKELYLFGPEITAEFPWLSKEIRELNPQLMKRAIEALGIFATVQVLDVAGAQKLNLNTNELILPDEDISRELAQKYFNEAVVTFDPLFLRWDRHNAIKEITPDPDRRVTSEHFHQNVIKDILEEAEKSSDIWRHVGAAVVKNGTVLMKAHNHHLPSEHTPYVNGDPRNNFHKGDHVEISSAIHAEAALIAEAASKGIALTGADMYVSTFPCPPCAKLIAHSGIKTLYYSGGYGVLDGEHILKSVGIALVLVV